MAVKDILKQIEVKTTGLGTNPNIQGERLLNQDGTFNVKKTGAPRNLNLNIYQFLIEMSWRKYIVFLIVSFFCINVFFSALYYFLFESHDFTGLEYENAFEKFCQLLFFSVQTLTTVGYGKISPDSIGAGFISSIQAFMGVIGLALASGITYGRYSRPVAHIIFSEHAIIAPYKKGKALMFRLANARNTQMINVEAKVLISMIDPKKNDRLRHYYYLDLELRKINFLPTSWTIVHPINEESIFKEYTIEQLKEIKAEVLVQIVGFDDTYNQPINARTSFKIDELVVDAKFKDIYTIDQQGVTHVDLTKLGAYEHL